MFWSEGPMDAQPAGTYYHQPPARQARPARRFGLHPHAGSYRDREDEMLRRQFQQQEILRQRDAVRRHRHHEQELARQQDQDREQQAIARERRSAIAARQHEIRCEKTRRSVAAATIADALARNVAKIRARKVTDALRRLWELQDKIDTVPGLTAEELAASSDKAANKARLLFGHSLEKLVLSADDIPTHGSATARAVRKRLVLSADARLQLLDDATAAADAAEAMADLAASNVSSDDGTSISDGAEETEETDETEGSVDMTDMDECDEDEVAATATATATATAPAAATAPATAAATATAIVDAVVPTVDAAHVSPAVAPAAGPSAGVRTEPAKARGDDSFADADDDADAFAEGEGNARLAAEDSAAMEVEEEEEDGKEEEDEGGDSDGSFEHVSVSATASDADTDHEAEQDAEAAFVEEQRQLARQAVQLAEDVGGAAAFQAAADAAARSHLAAAIARFSGELANLQSELQESTDSDLTNTVNELKAAVDLIGRD